MTIKDEDLINAAREARAKAYCKYSGFSVGAAIVDEQGQVHVGCNVENAAYNLGNCAEAAAIAAMVQGGGKRIVRIAVAGGHAEIASCTPCGGCRQRINEFADTDTRIILFDVNGEIVEYGVSDLLPASFSLR